MAPGRDRPASESNVVIGYVLINGKTLTFARANDAINNLAAEHQIGFRTKLRLERCAGSYTRVIIDFEFGADRFWSSNQLKNNGTGFNPIAQLVAYGPSITNVDCGIIDDRDIVPYAIKPHLRVDQVALIAQDGPASVFSVRIQTDKWYWHVKQHVIDDILDVDSKMDAQYPRRGEATPLIDTFLKSVNTAHAASVLDIDFIYPRPTMLDDRKYASIAKMLSDAREHEKPGYLDWILKPFRTTDKQMPLSQRGQIESNNAKLSVRHSVRDDYCDIEDFMVTQLHGAYLSGLPEVKLAEKLADVLLSAHVFPSKQSRQLVLAVDTGKERTKPAMLNDAEKNLLPKVIPSESQSCEVEFPSLSYTVGDDSVKWYAQRIEAPFPGFSYKIAWFTLTVPLEHDNESTHGRRPVQANFAMPPLAAGISNEGRAKIIRAHCNDATKARSVQFCVSGTDPTFEALRNALNDLHPSEDSAEESRASGWGISNLEYLLGFKPVAADMASTSPTLGERFPWMTWVLDTAERNRVHDGLLQMYDGLDRHQKACYAALLGQVTQRLRFINGVPGSGKTYLMRFVMLMAQYGDKTKARPAKFLYVGPQNHHVTDMASRLDKAAMALKLPTNVVRLTNVFNEKTRVKKGFGNSGLAYLAQNGAPTLPQSGVNASAPLNTGISNIQSGMSHLSVSVGNAMLVGPAIQQGQVGRDEELSVHLGMLRYLNANNEGSCADLYAHLQAPEVARATESWNERLASLIDDLLASYLGELTGCVCATPYQCSVLEFSKSYSPDVIFVDEGSRVSEGELLMVFRNFDPVLAAVFGDVKQLAVYVAQAQEKGAVVNPFGPMLERSTLHRAVALGLNDVNLWTNHRSVGELTEFTSDFTYNGRMKTGRTTPGDIQKAQAWSNFLHGYFTRRGGKKALEKSRKNPNRVIAGVFGSEEELVSSSQINNRHAEFVVDIAIKATTDPALDVGQGKGDILIIPFYLAQVYHINDKLDQKVEMGGLTRAARNCIRVRSVDGSQGDEASFVIWDTVRSKYPGFTTDRNRLNVAMTRSKFAEVGLIESEILKDKKTDTWVLQHIVESAKNGSYHATVYY